MIENESHSSFLKLGRFESGLFYSYVLDDHPEARGKIKIGLSLNGVYGDPDELEKFKSYLLNLHPDREEIIKREEVLSDDPLNASLADPVVGIITGKLHPEDESWWNQQPALFAHQYRDPVSNTNKREVFLHKIKTKEGLESQKGFESITQNEFESKQLDTQSIELTLRKLTDPVVVIRYKREQSTCYMELELQAKNNLAEFNGNRVYFKVDLDHVYPILKLRETSLTSLGFDVRHVDTNLIVELVNV